MTGRVKARCVAGLRDERGATAVFFAVGLLLLAPATMGLIDIYMITTQRGQLQDALDTATLYVARSNATAAGAVQSTGDAALRANLKLPTGQVITSSSFVLEGITIKGRATITPPSVGPRLWAQADIAATSEVLRNSNNVEVALVLDTTGSMSAQMGNLRTAAKDLVDLVVKDQQTPYYTKVALVPYSNSVNVGAYAQQARGLIRGPASISGITRANPAVVTTSADHNLVNGETVTISGVKGMTTISGEYVVANRTPKTFELKSTNTSSANKYTSGGTVQCLSEDCQSFKFTGADNKTKYWAPTNCVSERIGAEAYTDAAPGANPVGRRYYKPNDGEACYTQPIMPLSTNKTALKSAIDKLADNGSTAGQIGLAWGWYMVSPNFGSLFPSESRGAAYGTRELLKVVVLMTDGAFNTPYCKGVVAKNADSGSGGTDIKINCNATNGDPFTQAAELCRNMKDKKIIIYTVGFNVSSDTQVQNLMRNCATAPENVYMPNGGAELKVAFRAIAQDINSLRISK
ncbi:ubiquitin-activating E1 FCCH domain-containing protein [Phenylobacterium sp.]|uniref:ubiquitin-activating E1 FCCH domain-containing protein n=1 Tax=Phenylobacterium sp. TaxID=1871053 RepID=UPI00289ECF08|nr:ubiquitin-activating E1 FCCH domain-containing protein [Phenylobacterium sp.]